MHWPNYSTKLYGLIGRAIGYTASPAIHNYIFSEIKYNAVYLVFDIPEERFDFLVPALVELCEGLNITIPYKERIASYLSSLDSSAEFAKAVNTVFRGRGYNTDYIAVKKLAKRYMGFVAGAKCVVFGAGGAAKAAIAALGEEGCAVRVVNRSAERALRVVEEFRGEGIDVSVSGTSACSEADIVVNATPNPDVVLDSCLTGNTKLVIEFVYRPVETSLVRRARERGIPVINGLELLVWQAVEAQRIWHGVEFPAEKVLGYLYAGKLVW